MKTLLIRLSDVEVAMLSEVQRVQKDYRDLSRVIASQIAKEHEKMSRKRLS